MVDGRELGVKQLPGTLMSIYFISYIYIFIVFCLNFFNFLHFSNSFNFSNFSDFLKFPIFYKFNLLHSQHSLYHTKYSHWFLTIFSIFLWSFPIFFSYKTSMGYNEQLNKRKSVKPFSSFRATHTNLFIFNHIGGMTKLYAFVVLSFFFRLNYKNTRNIFFLWFDEIKINLYEFNDTVPIFFFFELAQSSSFAIKLCIGTTGWYCIKCAQEIVYIFRKKTNYLRYTGMGKKG